MNLEKKTQEAVGKLTAKSRFSPQILHGSTVTQGNWYPIKATALLATGGRTMVTLVI